MVRHRSILEYARFRWFRAAIALSIVCAAACLLHEPPLKPYGGTGLGTALVVVVTLHRGFELGWNVHTLAYVLMLAVVFSGIYGMVAYLRVPGAMTDNLGEDTLVGRVPRVGDVDRETRAKALSPPDSLLRLVDASIAGTRLGGRFWRLLTGRDRGAGPVALLPRAARARDDHAPVAGGAVDGVRRAGLRGRPLRGAAIRVSPEQFLNFAGDRS